MFAVVIAFVFFTTLSAFCPRELSFLFTWELERRTEMGEGEVGKRVKREGKEAENGKMGMHEKTAPKRSRTDWASVDAPWGLPPRVIHF